MINKVVNRIKEESLSHKIEREVYRFTSKGFPIRPTKLIVNKKSFEKLLREIQWLHNYSGVIIPKTYMGMDIEIDDRVESFEVVAHTDFLGVREVVR